MHNFKRFFLFFSICFFSLFYLRANIYSRPRKLYTIQTQHFDFIFPRGAEQTVYVLAENGDAIFEKAKKTFPANLKRRIPVVISLDSDNFSVKYTASPYNRIVIFQSPTSLGDHLSDDALLLAFEREVSRALASSVRGKFWEIIHFFPLFRGDNMQPNQIFNMPSAFLDGIVEAETGAFEDNLMLQSLVRAKSDGKFPRYQDVAGGCDIYPLEISVAAYSAFSVYIMQKWGEEKFTEFWKETGNFQCFKLNPGIFKKVYGVSLKKAWSDFVETIPDVPSNDDFGERVFKHSTQSTYSSLTESGGRLVYFDKTRDNLYLLEKNKKGKTKRHFLMMADGISSLSANKTGDYLALSYFSKRANKELTANQVQIFDLNKKVLLLTKLKLKNATFFEEKDETESVAGFFVKGNKVQLKTYSFDEKLEKNDKFLLTLPENIQIESLVSLGQGKLLAIYYYKKQCILQTIDVDTNETQFFSLPVIATNFKRCNDSVFFTYRHKDKFDENKVGYIEIDEKGNLKDVFLGTQNYVRGINDACLVEDEIYYYEANSVSHLMKKANFSDFKFDNEKITLSDVETDIFEHLQESLPNKIVKTKENKKKQRTLGDFQVVGYKPFKYLFHGAWHLFKPISSFEADVINHELGLGLSYETSSDPIDVIHAELSFCFGFIDMQSKDELAIDKNWTAAMSLGTSVLPVDLTLSSLFKFNNSGEYKMQVLFSSSYSPFSGMAYNNILLNFNVLWNVSTTVVDYVTNEVTVLDNWPHVYEAQNTLSEYFYLSYTNYHQSGRSVYEQRGMELSLGIINIFDPQKNDMDKKDYLTQVTLGGTVGFKFPFLLPIFNTGDWVLCLPTSFHSEWFGKYGTITASSVESVIVGYEVQKAIPCINLYIQRMALKCGYNFRLYYDDVATDIVIDVREIKNFAYIFAQSLIKDYFYIGFDATISPNIGRFARETKITAGLQIRFDFRKGDVSAAAMVKMNL